MEYKYEYICKMKEPVVCELCNKSYTIGRMKAHKQTKMHKENAEKCGVPSSWWFMGGTTPNAFVGQYNKQLAIEAKKTYYRGKRDLLLVQNRMLLLDSII